MIPSGVVAVHNNGKLARVIFPPTAHDSRAGVAFWLDDGRLMQMVWHMEWIAYWYDDIWDEKVRQMRLW